MNIIIFFLVVLMTSPAVTTASGSARSASESIAALGLAKAPITAGPEDFHTITLGQIIACWEKRVPGTPARTIRFYDDGNQDYRLLVHSSLGDLTWHLTATSTSAVFNALEDGGTMTSDPNSMSQVMLMTVMACAMHGNLGIGQQGAAPPQSGKPAGQE